MSSGLGGSTGSIQQFDTRPIITAVWGLMLRSQAESNWVYAVEFNKPIGDAAAQPGVSSQIIEHALRSSNSIIKCTVVEHLWWRSNPLPTRIDLNNDAFDTLIVRSSDLWYAYSVARAPRHTDVQDVVG